MQSLLVGGVALGGVVGVGGAVARDCRLARSVPGRRGAVRRLRRGRAARGRGRDGRPGGRLPSRDADLDAGGGATDTRRGRRGLLRAFAAAVWRDRLCRRRSHELDCRSDALEDDELAHRLLVEGQARGEREAGRGDHVGGRSAPQRTAGRQQHPGEPARGGGRRRQSDRGGAEDGRRRESLRRRRLLEGQRKAERARPPAVHRLAARPAVRGVAAQALELTGRQPEADRTGDRLFGLPARVVLGVGRPRVERGAERHPGPEEQRGGRFRGDSEDDRQPGGAQTLHVVQKERRALPQRRGTPAPPRHGSRPHSRGRRTRPAARRHGRGRPRRRRRRPPPPARGRRRGRTCRSVPADRPGRRPGRRGGTRPRAPRRSPRPRPPRRGAGAGRSRRRACGRAGSSGRSRHALRGAVPAAARPGRTRCRGHQPGAVWWMP